MDNYIAGGRKRTPSSQGIDEQSLGQISKQQADILAAKRQARAEAREIRMKELERQQKEAEENADKVFDLHNADISNRGIRNNISRNTSIISSPMSNNSRRSSEDSLEDSMNHRDLKHELKELEEKFRKAMVQNAQLDNEKAACSYQVELYKDKYQDLEEAFALLKREHKAKCRDYDQLQRLSDKQRNDLIFYKIQLEERDRMIEERGLIIAEIAHEELLNNGIDGNACLKETKRVLVSPESADILQRVEGSLDVRLQRFERERAEMNEIVSRLRLELEEERRRARSVHNHNHVPNSSDNEDLDDSQRELNNKLAGDYKFKWQKAEQDISTLQANVARLESQVIRYKSAAETSEKVEDDLKIEKRKLQREFREVQAKMEELETTNMHLQKRLDKLKNAKSALLKEI